VVAALRDWFDTFGETPLSYEWAPGTAEALGLPMAGSERWARGYPRWPSAVTVCRYFGAWARAVDAANLPPARAVAPRRDVAARIEAARRLDAAGQGVAQIAAVLEVSRRTVRGYLRAGSCLDCGALVVTGKRCPHCAARRAQAPQWTREGIIRAVRTWTSEQGRPPTSRDWTPTADARRQWAREYPRYPSVATVRTLFGGWRQGLEAAGVGTAGRRWDRTAIATALHEFNSLHGRPPTTADLARQSKLPSPATVRAYFGSVRAARRATNLPLAQGRWDRGRILDAMVHFYRHQGRLPTSRDWTRSTPDHPHATTVLQRFGRWSAATAAARARLRRPVGTTPEP
jgi:hypothetical protein